MGLGLYHIKHLLVGAIRVQFSLAGGSEVYDYSTLSPDHNHISGYVHVIEWEKEAGLIMTPPPP